MWVWSLKSKGIRIVGVGIRFAGVEEISGFLEQQEPPGGTHLAARRHTSDVWCSDSRKMLFFVFFAEQKLPGGSIVPSGATDFYGSCSFRKTAFPVSLTVRFRWNFGRWFTTCCSSLNGGDLNWMPVEGDIHHTWLVVWIP